MKTTERLAVALEEVGAPPEMIRRARDGFYDDYKSPLAMPQTMLLAHCNAYRLPGMARRVVEGEFDGTKEESEEWLASPDGQEAMRELMEFRTDG